MKDSQREADSATRHATGSSTPARSAPVQSAGETRSDRLRRLKRSAPKTAGGNGASPPGKRRGRGGKSERTGERGAEAARGGGGRGTREGGVQEREALQPFGRRRHLAIGRPVNSMHANARTGARRAARTKRRASVQYSCPQNGAQGDAESLDDAQRGLEVQTEGRGPDLAILANYLVGPVAERQLEVLGRGQDAPAFEVQH